jgi:hypothetical protein
MKKHGDNSLRHQNLVDDTVMFLNCLFLLSSLFFSLARNFGQLEGLLHVLQESVLSHIVRASVIMKLLVLAL